MLKILEINNKKVHDLIILDFEDQALNDTFPTNVFELYKDINGEEIGSINETESEIIKKQYVGKIFNISAYETTKSFGDSF